MNLCVGDRTHIWRNGILVGDTEVTHEIRQGCTGSPKCFEILANLVINNIVGADYDIEIIDDFNALLMIGADDRPIIVRWINHRSGWIR